MTVTPERKLYRCEMDVTYNRYKSVIVSLPRRLCNGRFASETAVRRAAVSEAKGHLDPEVVK
jgi:hypothetical protein